MGENLGADLKYYGFLGAALGAGVIIGALAGGWVSRRIGIAGAFNAGSLAASLADPSAADQGYACDHGPRSHAYP